MLHDPYWIRCDPGAAGGLLVASVSSINQLFYWQQQLVSREPLLRFPFISYLVDPCGSESKSDAIPPFLVMTDTPLDRTNLPGMRTLAADVPVAKHSFSFLSRFQDRYVFPFNYTKEDRRAIAQEFWLVLNEARGLVRRIYSSAVMRLFICYSLTSLRLNWSVSFECDRKFYTARAFSSNLFQICPRC